jgi:hypothetical protein
MTFTFEFGLRHPVPEGLYIRGGLEYLHSSPASRKRRAIRDYIKGTQCPGI